MNIIRKTYALLTIVAILMMGVFISPEPVSADPCFDCDFDCDINCDPSCTICEGETTELCATDYHAWYEWWGPGGFYTEGWRSNCIDADNDGEYTVKISRIGIGSEYCSKVVTVDTTSPTWDQDMPANVTVECDVVPEPATITASDNYDSSVNVVYNQVRTDGSCEDSYILTRTWTATDDCGNSIAHTQIITVDDTTAPDITCPDSITVECDEVVPGSDISLVTATDNCGTPVVTWVSDVSDGQTCPETITRTYQAEDDCSNTATCTQTITVDDTTAPVFDNCPEDITIICASVPEPPTLTATDNCDTAVVTGPVEEIISGDVASSNYTMTRTWTATDACVNSVECVQIITVKPCETPPVEEEEEEKPCYCSLVVQKRDEAGHPIKDAVFEVDGIEKTTRGGDARWDNLECDTTYEVKEISPEKKTEGIHLGDCGERSTLRIVNVTEELLVLGLTMPEAGSNLNFTIPLALSGLVALRVLLAIKRKRY